MRKLFTLFAALAFTIAAFAESSVYFLNDGNWTGTIKCYIFGAANDNSTSWGDAAAMTYVGKINGSDLYKFTRSYSDGNCIFYGSAQTDNLTWSDGVDKYYSGTGKSWNPFSTYYIKHEWNGGQDSWQAMTDNGNGTFSFESMWGAADCFWNVVGSDTESETIDEEDVVNHSSYAKGAWCKFTLNPAAGTITLSAITGTLRTVDVYHLGARSLYAFANYVDYMGKWPGTAASASDMNYINGAAWYHFAIKVLDGTNLSIIFSDEGENQTGDLSLGSITSNQTKEYYTSGTTNNGNTLFLAGDFNDWGTTDSDNPFYKFSNVLIHSFDEENTTPQIKIVDGGTWHTNNSGFSKSGEKDFSTTGGTGNHAWISVGSYTGDYVFVWDEPSNNHLTVYFPGDQYTRANTTANKWGTICVPYAVSTRSGANFYSIIGKDDDENPTTLYLEPVSAETQLVAGQPYFFKTTGTSDVVLNFTGSAAYAGSHNGLVGSYQQMDVAPGKYLLTTKDAVQYIQKITSGHISGCKAFIDMDKVPVDDGTLAPGRLAIPLGENNTTNIDAVEANEEAVKFIQNGQLFIMKNGVVYNAVGAIVK